MILLKIMGYDEDQVKEITKRMDIQRRNRPDENPPERAGRIEEQRQIDAVKRLIEKNHTMEEQIHEMRTDFDQMMGWTRSIHDLIIFRDQIHMPRNLLRAS